MSDNTAVVDLPGESRFVVEQDRAVAQLRYRVDGDDIYLIHTEVPGQLGGRGIGGDLVRAAVDKAAEENLRVHPWCPYARAWLERHPNDVSAVDIDWSEPGS